MAALTDSEVRNIIDLASPSCDQGRALIEVLDLLVAADLDDHVINDPSEEEYAAISEAETSLFLLACERAAALRKLNSPP